MRLSKALEEKLLDKRLRDKLLAEGKVSQAQVDEYLSALPDDGANATFTDKAAEKHN